MVIQRALTVPSTGFDRHTKQELLQWKEKHKDIAFSKYIHWDKTGNWGEIRCKISIVQKGKKETEDMVLSLDQKRGNIFVDTKKTEIAQKMFGILEARPFVIVVRTIYHLAMISILRAGIECVLGKIDKEEMQIRMIRSVVDIVRTPAYGVALTAIAAVGFLVSWFSKTAAYEMRDLEGRVENHLMWGWKSFSCSFHTLAPCMQPKKNIIDLGDDLDSFKIGLTKMVQSLYVTGAKIALVDV